MHANSSVVLIHVPGTDTSGTSYQSPYSPLAPPSYRDSNGSSLQSSLDARMSVASGSSANTQYSSFSESSTISKAFPPRKSSSNYRNAPDIRLQRAVEPSVESEAAPLPSVSTTPRPKKSRPASKPLPSPPSRKKYFCTVCEEGPWTRDSDWLLHEQTHHRQARWVCRCGLEFPTERRFRSHHAKGHSCQECDHAKDSIQITRAKKSLGCGFCCHYFDDLKARNSHVTDHYEAGKTKEDWSYDTMILSLLQSPSLASAWQELLERRAHGSDASSRDLSWSPTDSSSIVANLEYQEYGDNIVVLLERLYGLGRQLPEEADSNSSIPEASSASTAPQLLLDTAVQLTLTPARALNSPNSPTQPRPKLVVNQVRKSPQVVLARPDSNVLGDAEALIETATSSQRSSTVPDETSPTQISLSLPGSSLDLTLQLPTFALDDFGTEVSWDELISFPEPPTSSASLSPLRASSVPSPLRIAKPPSLLRESGTSVKVDPKQEVAATDEAMESFMSEVGIEPGTRISFMQID
jgi:hypothetical protein